MSATTKLITDSFKRTKQTTSFKQKSPVSDVQDTYQLLAIADKKTYAELVEALKQRFTPPNQSEFHRVRLRSREHKNDVKPSSSKDGSQREQEITVLKQFDLTLEFGPCIGVTRLERWMRAEKHGLNPPKDVKELLDQHTDDPEYTECLWKDYAI